MRTVTEPYSPAALDEEPGFRTHSAEERAPETCVVDHDVIDAALAGVEEDKALVDGVAGGEVVEFVAESTVNGCAPLTAASYAHPVWAQLAHLEELLCEWMTANPACDHAVLAELRSREAAPPPASQRDTTRRVNTTTVPHTTAKASDYIATMAAKLVRRSA
jgi:hypothetical protein